VCRYTFAVAFINEPGHVQGVLVFVELGDQDIGTFAGMADDRRTIDTAVVPGDHRRGLPVSQPEPRTDYDATTIALSVSP
jgi:hypothetical protein